MTLRELRVLVMNLPLDSANARAHRGHNWLDADYLLADISDTLRFHRAEWAKTHGADPPEPEPTTRPEVAARPNEPSVRDMAAAAHQHILDQIMPGKAPPVAYHRPAPEPGFDDH